MKKLISISFLIFTAKAFSITSPINTTPVSPAEAWIKLTCHGVVSPRYSWPAYEKPITVAHIKVNPLQGFPKYEELRDSNSDFFKAYTRICTERRWNKMEFGTWTGSWLDWGTDYAYTRYEIGEEIIYNSQQCRAVGKPCERLSQCCGYGSHQATCNLTLKSCESTVISVSTEVPSQL